MNVMKNRKPKIPDFPFIIDKLVKGGMEIGDIAEIAGTNRATISMVRNESCNLPSGWLASYYILDLYIRKYDVPVPFFGEHNE